MNVNANEVCDVDSCRSGWALALGVITRMWFNVTGLLYCVSLGL